LARFFDRLIGERISAIAFGQRIVAKVKKKGGLMKTLILSLVLVSTCLYSTIINVPADQPTIQDGIVAAAETDTVLVADGTYFENIDFVGKGITVASNFLIDADTLHIANTIINGSQPTDPDFGSCVRFTSNEDTTSVIIGFTLTEGTGCLVQAINEKVGGGIHCYGSSPKIVSNIVTNNSAYYAGGIGVQDDSSPILLNNVISYNTATDNNAGITIVFGSDPYLEGNIISNNTANNHIGGIMISDSSPTLVGNVIRDNSALTGNYGGICIQNDSSPVLLNNIICDNTAALYHGGIGVYYGSGTSFTTIENCQIYGNDCSTEGGGLAIYDASADVINCIISDNYSGTNGGGVNIATNADVSIINCTISGNTSGTGGGIGITSSDVTIINTIVEGNEAVIGAGINFDQPGNVDISFSNFLNDVTNFGGSVPTGLGVISDVNFYGDDCDDFFNIFEDPLFAGTGEHPFSLLEDSPCIDAGIQDTSGLNLPLFDIIGNERIVDGRGDDFAYIDIGAYEHPEPNDSDENTIVQAKDFLQQNYPNPFNPTTTISFSTTESTENTELVIYNLKGQKIRQFSIFNSQSSITWDGTDQANKPVSSGIYFYKLKAGNFEQTKKMILMK